MPSDKEIKPCPFCGEPGLIGRGMHGGWFVQCVHCGKRTVRTDKVQRRERAVQLWNLRRGEQKTRQEVLKKAEQIKYEWYCPNDECEVAWERLEYHNMYDVHCRRCGTKLIQKKTVVYDTKIILEELKPKKEKVRATNYKVKK